LRILTVVDDCTRECLALVADTSLSGTRVARELDRLRIERGKPKMAQPGKGKVIIGGLSPIAPCGLTSLYSGHQSSTFWIASAMRTRVKGKCLHLLIIYYLTSMPFDLNRLLSHLSLDRSQT
jgi:hypothetical protein